MLLVAASRARIAQHARGAIGAAAALGRDAEIELQALETVRTIGRGLANLAV